MLRPTDQNKNLSARIAARVSAASRLEVLPQCFEGLLQEDPSAHRHGMAEGAVDANVGIWFPQPEPNGMAYVRRAKDTQSSLWADVERIEPKGRRKRIVLLGESVARGYFYDPEFNPAMALRSILENAAGIDAVEIIDLACIDQSADELLFLAKSALRLQPDAYVVFAGNNWHPRRGFAPIATEEIARTLRWTRDWNSVIALIQERTSENAARILRALGDLSRHHNLPIIFLLPEFNLADWRPEFAGPNLFRTPETARAWRAARSAAEEAMQDGNGEGVARLARQMMELTGGTDPIGPNLLARCLFFERRMEDARKLFELARDTSLSLPGICSPRCYGVVQQTLRKSAPKEGITLVDLPKQFSEHLGGALPDRRLFHDYCHLTVEGTMVAMSSAAEHLLRILDCPKQSWRRLKDVPVEVAPATLAQAHLLAAAHNATWGQGPDIIHYHCANALRLKPELAKTLRSYLDACAKQAPTQTLGVTR
ncbi:MAG TPA: hypothetical protein VKH81_09875 [Candidatus Angelobacter sp.]|nr:hypothetical protein [Candidatus Angelobacter sp.]